MRKMLIHPAVKLVCLYLILFLSGIIMAPETARAAFISPSEDFVAGMDAGTLSSVRLALEDELLTERLSRLGLSAEEIRNRLEILSPQEHEAVLAELEGIQAGGDGVGTLVSLAVLVLIIILIIKLLDKEIIIK